MDIEIKKNAEETIESIKYLYVDQTKSPQNTVTPSILAKEWKTTYYKELPD
jgi:hypothetical protein